MKYGQNGSGILLITESVSSVEFTKRASNSSARSSNACFTYPAPGWGFWISTPCWGGGVFERPF